MRRLSRTADKSVLWLGVAGVLALVGGRTGRRAAVNGLVSIGLASATANLVGKQVTSRRRPDRGGHDVPEERHVPMPESTSFPSGHSASAFAFAEGVSAASPTLGIRVATRGDRRLLLTGPRRRALSGRRRRGRAHRHHVRRGGLPRTGLGTSALGHSVTGSRLLLPSLVGYHGRALPRDVVAGLVLTALLVPQGMAYAELAGLPAITGLYTSILCLVGYALIGPSRILVLGPDSSLGPMIAATILPARRCRRRPGQGRPARIGAGDPHRGHHGRRGAWASSASSPTCSPGRRSSATSTAWP